MIQRRRGKYVVVAHSGRTMGTYRTRAAALKRLRQVEYFKRHPNPVVALAPLLALGAAGLAGWGVYAWLTTPAGPPGPAPAAALPRTALAQHFGLTSASKPLQAASPQLQAVIAANTAATASRFALKPGA